VMAVVPIKKWVGTGLGSGLLPGAPGTWGSLAALVPAALCWYWAGVWGLVGALIVFLLLGFWSAPWFETRYGEDPPQFVMDEWAGQMIPLFAAASFTQIEWPYIWMAAFFTFRLFDILKPLGIRRAEQYRGASGIMLDDLLAGLYAYCTIFFVIFIYYTFF